MWWRPERCEPGECCDDLSSDTTLITRDLSDASRVMEMMVLCGEDLDFLSSCPTGWCVGGRRQVTETWIPD